MYVFVLEIYKSTQAQKCSKTEPRRTKKGVPVTQIAGYLHNAFLMESGNVWV